MAMTILIVDDHPGMCRTLQDILEGEGYAVQVAYTGADAIEACQRQHFDVILMDVRMPDLNGVDAFRRIKTFAENTRVIMMSAYSVDDLKREVLAEGAIAFLQKPLEVEQVLRLIEEAEQPPILLVMPDAAEREALASSLSQKPYRTYTVNTAEEALEIARQIRFHIIMIDTRLATMNGLDLYLALKEITPTSVTIMLAETDPEFIEQAEEAVRRSAYTFLPKPLDIGHLLWLLDQIQRQLHSNMTDKPGADDAGPRTEPGVPPNSRD